MAEAPGTFGLAKLGDAGKVSLDARLP